MSGVPQKQFKVNTEVSKIHYDVPEERRQTLEHSTKYNITLPNNLNAFLPWALQYCLHYLCSSPSVTSPSHSDCHLPFFSLELSPVNSFSNSPVIRLLSSSSPMFPFLDIILPINPLDHSPELVLCPLSPSSKPLFYHIPL